MYGTNICLFLVQKTETTTDFPSKHFHLHPLFTYKQHSIFFLLHLVVPVPQTPTFSNSILFWTVDVMRKLCSISHITLLTMQCYTQKWTHQAPYHRGPPKQAFPSKVWNFHSTKFDGGLNSRPPYFWMHTYRIHIQHQQHTTPNGIAYTQIASISIAFCNANFVYIYSTIFTNTFTH